MAAIREINVGVSQLEEVVQQNAAASHELAATSNDLAIQSSSLQQKVEFFRLDTPGNGYSGGSDPAAARVAPACGRRTAALARKLPAPRPRPQGSVAARHRATAIAGAGVPPPACPGGAKPDGPGGFTAGNIGTPPRAAWS